MIIPPFLKPGDTVSIVSTARKAEKTYIDKAIGLFREWGFRVVTGRHLYSVQHQFAGSDEERAYDLQQALDDPAIRAVVCARGGYGTVRIIDKIDFTGFSNNPKWIAGFSDVTVLHSHIHRNFGVQTMHAPMPVNLQDEYSREGFESLRKALCGEDCSFFFPPHPLNRPGSCQGLITGGNLSILYSLIGSASQINTAGKILFLEDVDEYLYHIDRMMLGLKRSGMLDNLAGLMIGGMSDMRDNETPYGMTAEEIILDAVKNFNYPVFFSVPAGHIFENRVLILGREAEVVSGRQMSLRYKP
ncbi:MAG: LD-carboxypeptidase [Bacteroidetes bacterium]|nr:LD-carboxypeptidase [Bacteroidota bacterium]